MRRGCVGLPRFPSFGFPMWFFRLGSGGFYFGEGEERERGRGRGRGRVRGRGRGSLEFKKGRREGEYKRIAGLWGGRVSSRPCGGEKKREWHREKSSQRIPAKRVSRSLFKKFVLAKDHGILQDNDRTCNLGI